MFPTPSCQRGLTGLKAPEGTPTKEKPISRKNRQKKRIKERRRRKEQP